AGLQQAVEALDRLAGQVHQITLVGLLAEAGMGEDFLVGGFAAQAAGQLAHRVAQLVGLLAYPARTPVLAAQLVEDGAAHPQAGEAGEAVVRLADRFHVLAVQGRAGLQRQLADDAFDQRQVLQQPALFLARAEQRRLGGHQGLGGAGGVHGYWASSRLTSKCSKDTRRLRSSMSWRSASSSSNCSSGMVRLRTTS